MNTIAYYYVLYNGNLYLSYKKAEEIFLVPTKS
ncbi:hypothetical protein QE357_003458 [Siphonobacter sp. BAB-5404]|nr:hypothetical protein [Siphonobacter sp. SORGH_AS_0500]